MLVLKRFTLKLIRIHSCIHFCIPFNILTQSETSMRFSSLKCCQVLSGNKRTPKLNITVHLFHKTYNAKHVPCTSLNIMKILMPIIIFNSRYPNTFAVTQI